MAESYNELFGLGSHSANTDIEGWWPLQDDAASTAVADQGSKSHNGTLQGGSNTEDIAVAGPNGWLQSALDLDGVDDHVQVADDDDFSFGDGSIDVGFTLLCRSAATGTGGEADTAPLVSKYTDPVGGGFDGEYGWQVSSAGAIVKQTLDDASNDRCRQDTSAGEHPLDGTWHNYSSRYDGSAVDEGITIRKDKADLSSTGLGQDGSYVAMHNRATPVSIGANLVNSSFNGYHDGAIADAAIFRGELATTDIDEWEDGPEPVNSVAPAVSGTEQVGQTLSVTDGTWGLPSPFSSGSNGTVTFAYQWTRSDDNSGTNETDIAGATGDTYELVSADVGKFLRCRVRASNDGGFDEAADTESDFSGEIISPPSPSGQWDLVPRKTTWTLTPR